MLLAALNPVAFVHLSLVDGYAGQAMCCLIESHAPNATNVPKSAFTQNQSADRVSLELMSKLAASAASHAQKWTRLP